jgi:pimeloyl-ACP methyl ester carboxylesterase
VAGLILENTFTSISDMVDRIFPFLANFKHLILRINWPTIERIPKIKLPILFVVGSIDEIVPPDHVHRLNEAASNAKFKKLH